ncbi:MAG TPA: hypothetical protein VKB59_13760 [Micromonosporaceae bacterium]|nr:hypothetical protein [Micromonosporaceae bacterium]
MYGFLAHPTPVAIVAASGTHHGGRAALWIIGWLVVLAVVVGVVAYLVRRRNQGGRRP